MRRIFLTNPTARIMMPTMVTKQEISKVMSVLGKKTSKAKAEAARRNGRKGGRPKAKGYAA